MQCWQLHVCGWNGLFPSELLSFYWCGCYRNKSRYLGIERADMCVLPCVCVCLFVLVTYYGWTESSLSPRWRRLRRCLCGTYWFLVTSHTSVLWTSCISPKTCEVNEQRFPSREGEVTAWMSVSAFSTSRVGWAGVTFSKFSAALSSCTAKRRKQFTFQILVTCTPAGIAVIFGSAWSLNSSHASVIHSLSLEQPPHL